MSNEDPGLLRTLRSGASGAPPTSTASDHRPSRNVSGSAVANRDPPNCDFFQKAGKAVAETRPIQTVDSAEHCSGPSEVIRTFEACLPDQRWFPDVRPKLMRDDAEQSSEETCHVCKHGALLDSDGYSFSNPCVSNFSVRVFSVTVRTVFSGTPFGT